MTVARILAAKGRGVVRTEPHRTGIDAGNGEIVAASTSRHASQSLHATRSLGVPNRGQAHSKSMRFRSSISSDNVPSAVTRP
jgi:hypothetical protein